MDEITELKAKLFDIKSQIEYLERAFEKGMNKLRALIKEKGEENETAIQEPVE